MKKLTELIVQLETIAIIGDFENAVVEDVTVDSREIKRNSLFVAIKGERENGHKIGRASCRERV